MTHAIIDFQVLRVAQLDFRIHALSTLSTPPGSKWDDRGLSYPDTVYEEVLRFIFGIRDGPTHSLSYFQVGTRTTSWLL